MGTVLVIDDHETVRLGISKIVDRMGHHGLTAASGAEGLELFRAQDVDFVITDLKMEGMDGVEVLRRIRELDPDVPVMIITAYGTVETAVEAMKIGAFDFVTKPFAPEVVRLKVTRAMELCEARRARNRFEQETEYLRGQVELRCGELVGRSEAMQQIFRAIEKVAPTDTTVLITGESGTGKELVARAIHAKSKRAGGPFVAVNCGALAEGLLESELFGHERGAFTGAVRRKMGRFELANGGTLFLDEISEISPALQVKLLRAIQERTFERVGSERTIEVDVRIVAATNRNLEERVRQGLFREDLLYRIMVVPIEIPPLRDRREDIVDLSKHLVERLSQRLGMAQKVVSDEALGRLMAHHWPGNVRELENALEQALVFCDGERIEVDCLPTQLRPQPHDESTLSISNDQASLPEILEDLERQLILKAYHESGGTKTETARRLGIKTSALYYKLDKYGIR
ncbi:MAG: sigma-54-dependent Fis family transcriptional regulator [Deltaproteobacteria bacterium]|nr:sigma-54-dependent Fis family transcriptional regulator [Deltaproteobacteria bacterium]